MVVTTAPTPDLPPRDLRDALVRIDGPDWGTGRWLVRPDWILDTVSSDRDTATELLAAYRAWRRRFETVAVVSERWQLEELAPADATGWLAQLIEQRPDHPVGGFCGDVPSAAVDELAEAVQELVTTVTGVGVEIVSRGKVVRTWLAVNGPVPLAQDVELTRDGRLVAGGTPVDGWTVGSDGVELDRPGQLSDTAATSLQLLAPGRTDVAVRSVPAGQAVAALLVGIVESCDVAARYGRPVAAWQVGASTV